MILFPTDFSDSSAQVFPYALDFAAKTGLSIHIVHFYQVDLGEFHGATHFQYTDIEKNLTEEMENFLKMLPKNPKVRIESSLEIGFPIQSIKRLARKGGKYDYIVMSTQGQRNALERFFGSIAAEVSVRADIPVLLIPSGVEYKHFENIVFAANRESVHKESIDAIRALVKLYHSTVHFVYVGDGREKGDKEEIREKIINILFEEDTPDFPFLIHLIEGEQVMDGINHYIDKTNADLTVFCNISRNFWRSILHRSTTKRMIMNTRVPMLVIHLEEEQE
ncbi:MAG: universal stress protein [Saprospirales bacterium]|nr:MAG: universal stress protein [Saprospirales bacterium]